MKFFLILARMMLALAALLISLLLVLAAVNWNDRAPNANSQRFDNALLAQPMFAPSLNAYVHMLALDIPPDEDVVSVGTARAAWLAQVATSDAPTGSMFPDGLKPEPVIPPAPFATLYEQCKDLDRNCERRLMAAPELLEAYIVSRKTVINRYSAMLLAPGWREVPGRIEPAPAYGAAIAGQRMHFLLAWRASRAGEVESVATALAADIQFWRNVEASSSTLISKMVAAAAIANHFQWSGIVLGALKPDQQVKAVPLAWRDPMTPRERSFLLPFAGEQAFFRGHVVNIMRSDVEKAYMARLGLQLGLFQRQDFLNRFADLAAAVDQELNVDYADLSHAWARAEDQGMPLSEEGFLSDLYNPVGKELAAQGFQVAQYVIRVADLEGLRRAALLAAELRSKGIRPKDLQEHLDRASARDPYEGTPFVWDEATNAIVVQGIARHKNAKRFIEF